MITTEHTGGFLDLESRRIGTVQIQNIVRRKPELMWQCFCLRCGSKWVSKHVLLVSGLTSGGVTCPNRSCGLTP